MGVGMSLFRSLVWNKQLTVYHRVASKDANGKTVTDWSRFYLDGCFFGHRARQVISGTEIVPRNGFIARILSKSMPDGFAIGKGDIVVKGHVNDTLQQNDSGTALRNKYAGSCFVVNVLVDNRDLPNTAHVFVSED